MFQIFFKNMVLWVESGSLEKKAGLEDRKPKKAEAGSSALYNPALCFITQLFFKGAIGNPEKGGGSRGEGEKWGREFLVQIIPWFSARSKVWEFCGALGSGTKENVTWQGQQFLTLIQILALGGGELFDEDGGRAGMNRWHLTSVGDRRLQQLVHSIPGETFPEQTESPLNCLHMDFPLGGFFEGLRVAGCRL